MSTSSMMSSGHKRSKHSKRKKELQKRNYLVKLVVTKTGAGKHKDKKKIQKNTHQLDT
jgi:hypothetical protein